MGARDKTERTTSLEMLAGVSNKDEMEVSPDDNEGVEATVCKISPI